MLSRAFHDPQRPFSAASTLLSKDTALLELATVESSGERPLRGLGPAEDVDSSAAVVPGVGHLVAHV